METGSSRSGFGNGDGGSTSKVGEDQEKWESIPTDLTSWSKERLELLDDHLGFSNDTSFFFDKEGGRGSNGFQSRGRSFSGCSFDAGRGLRGQRHPVLRQAIRGNVIPEENLRWCDAVEKELDKSRVSATVIDDAMKEDKRNCDKSRVDECFPKDLGPGDHVTSDSFVDFTPNKPVTDWRRLFKVQKDESTRMKFFEPMVKDGKITVKPPVGDVEEGIAKWKNCLVGQFVDRRLPFMVVRNAVTNLWGKKEIPEILTIDSGLYIFRFSNFEARDWVMDNGPWFISGKPLILRPWRPKMEMLNVELKTVPIWIRMSNIPPEYWYGDCLSYLASAVGVPLHMDAVTEERTRLSYARICVEVSVEKELPKSFDLDMGNGETTEIKVDYQWKPPKCLQCQVFGHKDHQCPKAPKKVWKVKTNVVRDTEEVPKVGNDHQRSIPVEESTHIVRSIDSTQVKEKGKTAIKIDQNMFDVLEQRDHNEVLLEANEAIDNKDTNVDRGSDAEYIANSNDEDSEISGNDDLMGNILEANSRNLKQIRGFVEGFGMSRGPNCQGQRSSRKNEVVHASSAKKNGKASSGKGRNF